MNKWKILARVLRCVFCLFSFVLFSAISLANVVNVMYAETLPYAIFHTCFALLFGVIAFYYTLSSLKDVIHDNYS